MIQKTRLYPTSLLSTRSQHRQLPVRKGHSNVLEVEDADDAVKRSASSPLQYGTHESTRVRCENKSLNNKNSRSASACGRRACILRALSSCSLLVRTTSWFGRSSECAHVPRWVGRIGTAETCGMRHMQTLLAHQRAPTTKNSSELSAPTIERTSVFKKYWA